MQQYVYSVVQYSELMTLQLAYHLTVKAKEGYKVTTIIPGTLWESGSRDWTVIFERVEVVGTGFWC